jgi:hypothetical protein
MMSVIGGKANYSEAPYGRVAQGQNKATLASGNSKKPDNSSLFHMLRVTDPRSGAWVTRPYAGCHDQVRVRQETTFTT